MLRVYIITWRNFDTGDNVFRDVLFTKEAAEKWVQGCKRPETYEITEFVETENGNSKEV